MPDWRVTSRDPYKLAKAEAEARYGRSATWMSVACISLGVSLAAFVVLGAFEASAGGLVVISAAYLPAGLALLVAIVRERSRARKRSRLIDELWQTYKDETSRPPDRPHDLDPGARKTLQPGSDPTVLAR